MELLLILVLTAALCLASAEPLRRCPAVFYALAAVLDVLFVIGSQGLLLWVVWSAMLELMRKCGLSFSLFAVVMYVGVFPKGSWVRRRLQPVRGELSVIACILALGHMGAYAVSYVPRVIVTPFVVAGLVVAAVLTVLLVVLGVTSLRAVKARMGAQTWVKVQRWAYLFYVLVFAHALLMLLPSALFGGLAAMESVTVYTVVFAVYFVARIVRVVLDGKRVDAGVRE